MIKKLHIFMAALGSAWVLMLVVLLVAGLQSLEAAVWVICAGATAWLCWKMYIEAKTLIVQVNSLKHDYKDMRNKVMESTMQAKDYKLQVELLRRQKQNTEAIIYSISDAVIVTDVNDRLLVANDPAGEIFGFDPEKSNLRLLAELVDNQELIRFIKKSREGKIRNIRHEIVIDGKEQQFVYDCIISCIFDEDEKICGAVTVLHDVTREKEISQMKNEFVSHVSHELKTPLASITAYSEMLADGKAADEKTREEFYSIIQTQAQRLNRLIEDILNVSRIESGLIKVSKEPLSATLLIRDAVQMIKSYAAEKNIEIKDETSVVFDQVSADKDMISQVIINLLSNAVKYTPNDGQVTVDSEVDESQKVVRIKVTDTGVGIPAEDVDKVFDKFFRVKANNKCAKGTGLGLNLVKQIVEKVHDGMVFVTSQPGKGSCFGFELPLMTEKVTAD